MKELYKDNKKARSAIDQHMDLLDTMAKCSSINDVEKFQKKSLKQIRELINQVVLKRKLRDGISNYNQISLAKPPKLNVVRKLTKHMNKNFAKILMTEVQRTGPPKSNTGPMMLS